MSTWSDSLSDAERRQHLVYAKLSTYARRKELARAILERGLALTQHPYVACSFGKDSAVLLHMALQLNPTIDVRFLRWAYETEYLGDYDTVIAAWRDRYPQLNLTTLELHRTSLEQRVGGRFDQLAALTPADGVLIGLRAEESRGRRMTLRVHGDVYQTASGMVRICPLAWWTTQDVASYCLEHDLPLLNTYAGEGISARTSARVPRGDHGIRSQALSSLKRRDPSAFAALAEQYPEVFLYV